MANLLGVNQTLIDAGGISIMLGGIRDARVKCVIDSVVVTAALAVAETVKLFGAIPKGANILAIQISTSVTQAAGACIDIGDSNTVTRYGTSVVMTVQSTAGQPVMIPGKGYVVGTVAGDNQILLTQRTAVATDATWYGVLYYTTD